MSSGLVKSEHLVLLVGGNPLPNVVAGRLLCPEGGTVTLVHSGGPQGTKRLAERIQQHLPGKTPKFVEVNESEPGEIYRKVRAHLDDVYKDRTIPPSVALNYTGGTKAMAVHVAAAVKGWAAEQGAAA